MFLTSHTHTHPLSQLVHPPDPAIDLLAWVTPPLKPTRGSRSSRSKYGLGTPSPANTHPPESLRVLRAGQQGGYLSPTTKLSSTTTCPTHGRRTGRACISEFTVVCARDPSGDVSRGMVRTGGGDGPVSNAVGQARSLENGALFASIVPPAPAALHRRGRSSQVPLLGGRRSARPRERARALRGRRGGLLHRGGAPALRLPTILLFLR